MENSRKLTGVKKNMSNGDGCSNPIGKPCVKVSQIDTRITDVMPKILVLPVSGNGLVEQLGITLWLGSRGYKPETCLGASGGAIVASIGTIFDWDVQRITEWMYKIPSFDTFKHHQLGFMEAFYQTSFYKLGDGLEYIFSYITKPEHESKLKKNEILILVQNYTKGRAEIFSTSTNRNSLLKDAYGPLQIFGVHCNVTFLGDLRGNEYCSMLRKVLKATSAVPIVFPPVEIDGNLYTDGGCSFSSPLNPIMGLNRVTDVLYVLSEDIELEQPAIARNTLDVGQGFFASLSRSKYIQDRGQYLAAICGGKYENLKKLDNDASNLYDVLKKTSGKKRMIELFPCIQRSLPIMSNHSKTDIFKRAMEQLSGFRCRVFYVE